MKNHLIRLALSLTTIAGLAGCMTAGSFTCVYDSVTGEYHCGAEVGRPPVDRPGTSATR